MSEKKMDMAKVLAILSQPREALPPLEHVERRTVEVSYITRAGKVDARKVRIFQPEKAARPMPLIYVPHYEMGEDAVELRSYLAKGWAVACPTEAPPDANGRLTDDDLTFNNAALYALWQMEEFDKKRIVLVGGSAGAYMTLMLMGQNLGVCAAIANGPITNAYFNFHHYFQKVQALNLQALAKMAAEAKVSEKAAPAEPVSADAMTEASQDEAVAKNAVAQDEAPQDEAAAKSAAAFALMQRLSSVPVPFIAALGGQFAPILENFPDETDVARWEALSGVGIAGRFCNPLMVNHSTSDVLVPVDQISKRFTYEKPGESLPEDFDARLPQTFPGKLKCSLEECLPEGDTRTLCIAVPENAEAESELPYDSSKRFNINIFDDGPIEGYGSHSSRMDVGRRVDIPYLDEMMEAGAAKTNILTTAMLKYLLDLYLGESVGIPAHEGVDDTVYGSLAIYREKVCRELAGWMEDNGEEKLRQVFDLALQEEADGEQVEKYKAAMGEILVW